MTTLFEMTRDINGYNGFGLNFADDNQSMLLTQDIAQSVTVPSAYGTWIAIFSIGTGSTVWVTTTGTAAAPTGAAASTASVMNPTARKVYAGQTISLITHDTNAYVGISFYALQSQSQS